MGSRVLEEVERLAKEWKYAKVLLKPKPLDNGWSNIRLERWYTNRGYKPSDPERPDVWTKAPKQYESPFLPADAILPMCPSGGTGRRHPSKKILKTLNSNSPIKEIRKTKQESLP